MASHRAVGGASLDGNLDGIVDLLGRLYRVRVVEGSVLGRRGLSGLAMGRFGQEAQCAIGCCVAGSFASLSAVVWVQDNGVVAAIIPEALHGQAAGRHGAACDELARRVPVEHHGDSPPPAQRPLRPVTVQGRMA